MSRTKQILVTLGVCWAQNRFVYNQANSFHKMSPIRGYCAHWTNRCPEHRSFPLSLWGISRINPRAQASADPLIAAPSFLRPCASQRPQQGRAPGANWSPRDGLGSNCRSPVDRAKAGGGRRGPAPSEFPNRRAGLRAMATESAALEGCTITLIIINPNLLLLREACAEPIVPSSQSSTILTTPGMASSSSSNRAVAYSGAPPGKVPLQNAFAFLFSQPFQTVSDFTPPAHVVPRIEATRPILVDHKSGMMVTEALLPEFPSRKQR